MAQIQIKNVRTSTLLHKLFKSPNLETFMENNSEVLGLPKFNSYISALCKDTGKVPEQVIKRSAIDRTYGHQLFNGTRKPSRDKVLQLAIGFGLDVDGAQELLKLARQTSLYPRIKRDAVILRCLNVHKDIIETQCTLQALGLTLLGGDEKHG